MIPIITLLVCVPSLTVMLFLLPLCGFQCARQGHDKRWDWMLAAGVLVLPIGVIVDMSIRVLSKLVPYKMDLFVYRYSEASLGAPSFYIGRFLHQHFSAYLVVFFLYSILPCVVMAVFSSWLWLMGTDGARKLAVTFILNVLLAIPIYLVFPVCGPAYAFSGFPDGLPGHIIAHPVLISAPPNGVPSIHFATALLVLWFARPWKWGSILAAIYLGLIAVATLGLGEHYSFDLLIAVPYSALVIWLADGMSIEKEDSIPDQIEAEEVFCLPSAGS